jgi:hypothetical protein
MITMAQFAQAFHQSFCQLIDPLVDEGLERIGDSDIRRARDQDDDANRERVVNGRNPDGISGDHDRFTETERQRAAAARCRRVCSDSSLLVRNEKDGFVERAEPAGHLPHEARALEPELLTTDADDGPDRLLVDVEAGTASTPLDARPAATIETKHRA